MIKDNQGQVLILRKKIQVCSFWYSLSGTTGLLAIGLIPLSILLGNKLLGFCAFSWIAGSFFAFMASTSKAKRNELEDEICDIEALRYLEVSLKNTPRQSIQTGFGPIGLN